MQEAVVKVGAQTSKHEKKSELGNWRRTCLVSNRTAVVVFVSTASHILVNTLTTIPK